MIQGEEVGEEMERSETLVGGITETPSPFSPCWSQVNYLI